MYSAGTVLILAAVLAWLAFKELPGSYGLLLPTGSMGGAAFRILSVLLTAGAMLTPAVVRLGEGLVYGTGVEAGQMVIILLAALLSAVILDRFALMPSVCTAFVGAMEGFRLVARDNLPVDLQPLLNWGAAVFAAFLLAWMLDLALKSLFVKSGIHIITLSYWMKYVAFAGMCLGFAAAGASCGAVFHAAGAAAGLSPAITAAGAGAVLALLGSTVLHRSYSAADRRYELSLHSAISVSLSMSVVLICFSSSSFCGLIHMEAAPQSIPALTCAALLGVSASRRNFALEPSAAGKSFAGLILSPALALVTVYFSFSLIRRSDNSSYPMVLAVFVLLMAGMAGLHLYRAVRRSREETDRLLAAQQQQIYENQKALNSMELKAVLDENEHLHGTLERKRRELVDIALNIGEQKEYLNAIAEKLRGISSADSPEDKDRMLSELEREIQQRLQNDNRLDDFYARVELLHKDFSVKLAESFPTLTAQERKLATLLRLGFSTKYIASLMYITPKSVEIERYRLRRKLGLKRSDNLITFIKSI